jgi:hypothetical protein
VPLVKPAMLRGGKQVMLEARKRPHSSMPTRGAAAFVVGHSSAANSDSHSLHPRSGPGSSLLDASSHKERRSSGVGRPIGGATDHCDHHQIRNCCSRTGDQVEAGASEPQIERTNRTTCPTRSSQDRRPGGGGYISPPQKIGTQGFNCLQGCPAGGGGCIKNHAGDARFSGGSPFRHFVERPVNPTSGSVAIAGSLRGGARYLRLCAGSSDRGDSPDRK